MSTKYNHIPLSPEMWLYLSTWKYIPLGVIDVYMLRKSVITADMAADLLVVSAFSPPFGKEIRLIAVSGMLV